MKVVALAVLTFLVAASVPAQQQGDIFWRPPGGQYPANYVQGPWAVQYQGEVFLGGHAGYFGEPWNRLGDERPWVIKYDSTSVTFADRVLDFPPDTHEFGFGSMVRANGWWLYAGVRTTWTSWIKLQKTGIGDRVRGMLALAADPLQKPYPFEWWDVIVPYYAGCEERNVCGDSGTVGVMHPVLVWIGDALMMYVDDPSGLAIWRVGIYEDGRYTAPAYGPIALAPRLIYSDIAWGDDGRLYALVAAVPNVCWWWNCPTIDEYVSDDLGLTWQKGTRSWSTTQTAGDACYVRDELGHIRRDAIVVVALVMKTFSPGDGTWYLHWWADPGAVLPRTWGHEPGYKFPRIRRHLTSIIEPSVLP